MNMMKKMNAVEIARYINNEVGMNVAHIDDGNNVLICADRDFLGNEIFFNDYLFCGDSIYSYINQHGFNCEMPEFGTNSYSITDEPDWGYKCFNPEGKHGHDCEFDEDTGIRKFDEKILRTAIEGLKKALKVDKQSKFTISNEVEFMDI
jgi:hypothetical protein